MPNRIIREGLVDSEPFNALSWQAQVFFVRLMLKADDFGRYLGDPKLLKPYLYALKLEDVREADLQRWIAECEKSGLVRGYESSGKRYLLIPKFGQSRRAEKSKFPEPTECSATATQSLSNRDAAAPVVVVEDVCEDEGVSFVEMAERIYEAYPRKEGRQDALKAIQKTLKTKDFHELLEATEAYAKAVAQWAPDRKQFIPHPATWFNRGSYDDERTNWSGHVNRGGAQANPSLFREGSNRYSEDALRKAGKL